MGLLVFKFIAIPNTLSSNLRHGLVLLIPLLVACGDGNQDTVPTTVPSPTAIIIPTSIPAPVVVARGIGVSRSDFTSLFLSESFGFNSEDSPLRDGRDQLMLTAPDGKSTIHLIGPSDDLTEATIIAWSQDISFPIYIIGFMAIAIPEWAEGSTWIANNLSKLIADPSTPIHAQYGNIKIEYSYIEVLGMLSITVNSM